MIWIKSLVGGVVGLLVYAPLVAIILWLRTPSDMLLLILIIAMMIDIRLFGRQYLGYQSGALSGMDLWGVFDPAQKGAWRRTAYVRTIHRDRKAGDI